jgi:hypothetical protein
MQRFTFIRESKQPLRDKTDSRDITNKRCLHFDDDSNNDSTLDTTKLASGFDWLAITLVLHCIQIAFRAHILEMNQENGVILKYHGAAGQVQ